jgi:hypothetical protein
VQLLPQLIYFLRLDTCAHAEAERTPTDAPGIGRGLEADAATPALLSGGGMDFASVLVYTCSSSCTPEAGQSVPYTREHVVVIPEYRGKPHYLTWGGMFVKAQCPPEVEAAGTNAKARSRKGSDCSTPRASSVRSARDEYADSD